MFTWLNLSWQIFGWAESSYLSYILRPQTGNANGCSWRIWWCLNTQQLRPNLFSVNILVITLNIFYNTNRLLFSSIHNKVKDLSSIIEFLFELILLVNTKKSIWHSTYFARSIGCGYLPDFHFWFNLSLLGKRAKDFVVV